MDNITIKIDTEVKDFLFNAKVHPRETYNDVLRRLLFESLTDARAKEISQTETGKLVAEINKANKASHKCR